MNPSAHVVVFADIDYASLTTWSSHRAIDVHDILERKNITLVLCSHMTRAELQRAQQELGIGHPVICESGAALLVPHGYFPFHVPHDRDFAGHHAIEFGRPYANVVEVLHRTAARLGIDIVGFSDLSVEQVATECHLSLSQARLAKLREYNEPFRIINSTAAIRDRLCKALYAIRFACTYRGAYDHAGAAVDKGISVGLLITLYRRAFGPLITVGLWDASNSIGLLNHVKIAYVVQTESVESNSRLVPRIPRLHLGHGLTPWIEAIGEIAHQAREQERCPPGRRRA